MLSIIVASDTNGGIGKDNKLLFKIKEDMKRFKELTTGKTIIMGRKTFESLPNGFLPNRYNIVLTTNINDNDINIIDLNVSLTFKEDIDELIDKYKDSDEEVFVIGGGEIYKQLLPYCDKIYLTRIYGEYEADTFFKYDKNEFELDYCSQMLSSDEQDYRFLDLVRVGDEQI